MLRNKLLKTNLFIDNEYFSKYINLVLNPHNCTDAGIIMEQHHIIPRSYFKHFNLPVDNSSDNLVTLDVRNHVLAHYYLTLCSKEDWFYYGNAVCVSLLTNRGLETITEDWIYQNLNEINNIKQYRLYLNSILQKGLQSGEKNPNVKYSLDLCNKVKYLLTLGKMNKEIINETGVPEHIITKIRGGKHWSCKEDGFSFTLNDTKQLLYRNKLDAWLNSNPTCKVCGKPLTTYIKSKVGDGCFCSKHCILSYASCIKFKEHPELKNKMIANRDYSGDKNPNFGKKASVETRQKISLGIKQSGCLEKSTRFKGHVHTEESRAKTSQSLKKRYEEKRKLCEVLKDEPSE